MSATIKTGTCGWTDRTLLDAGWYPPDVRTPEARLRHYAARFPLVENDATYYAPPAERQARLWAERTPPGFTMSFKAYAALTTHYTDPRRLPADVQELLPAETLAKRRVYPKDLGPEVMESMWQRFRDALAPLHEAGKLGAVLFQYPPWFAISRESKDHLLRSRERLADHRVAAEFRNATWMSERNREETLRFLSDHDIAYVSVDAPQGFPSSLPPIAAATTDLAVVRMHGRNAETWQGRTATAAERFNYRYSPEELAEWAPRVRRLAEEASEVHVLMNNCYADHAVVNAKQMAELLA